MPPKKRVNRTRKTSCDKCKHHEIFLCPGTPDGSQMSVVDCLCDHPDGSFHGRCCVYILEEGKKAGKCPYFERI